MKSHDVPPNTRNRDAESVAVWVKARALMKDKSEGRHFPGADGSSIGDATPTVIGHRVVIDGRIAPLKEIIKKCI
ncbi:MAG: hypothetical protein AAB573_02605 [Patescibacteria group bacterium]